METLEQIKTLVEQLNADTTKFFAGTNIDTIYLFIFIFSVLSVFRIVLKFIFSLLQASPERLVMSNREILFQGITLSYVITYTIQNLL